MTLGSDLLKTYVTTASQQGDWTVEMAIEESESNYTISVGGSETENNIVARYVRAGDVFFCSGQSNMVFPMKLTLNASQEIETLQFYPNFRFFMTNIGASNETQFLLPRMYLSLNLFSNTDTNNNNAQSTQTKPAARPWRTDVIDGSRRKKLSVRILSMISVQCVS